MDASDSNTISFEPGIGSNEPELVLSDGSISEDTLTAEKAILGVDGGPDPEDIAFESDTSREKQESYRDARITGKYDNIWQNVGRCVFCDLGDDDAYTVYEENGIILRVSLYAYIDGHMMIIPRRHVRSVKELTKSEWETMRKFMYIAKKIIRSVHGVKGMQIIQKDGAVAQSTVEHLHFHCIPFDSPDLTVWNYRKLANTPIENTKQYTDKKTDMEKLAKRFSQKYQNE